VSKVAYNYGMVVSTCRHCKNKHLIADNEGKLDMPEYGKKIEEYLKSKGENIQKLSITAKDLEDNYLIDKDGILTLVPKVAGQVSKCILIANRYSLSE
jgi:DNL zinc finger